MRCAIRSWIPKSEFAAECSLPCTLLSSRQLSCRAPLLSVMANDRLSHDGSCWDRAVLVASLVSAVRCAILTNGEMPKRVSTDLRCKLSL